MSYYSGYGQPAQVQAYQGYQQQAPIAKQDDTWRQLSERVRELVRSQIEDELRSREYSSSSAQEAATTVSER